MQSILKIKIYKIKFKVIEIERILGLHKAMGFNKLSNSIKINKTQ
jgi:hypothetical protein